MDEKRIYKVDYTLKIDNKKYDRTCYVKAYDKTNAFRVAGFYVQATTGLIPEIDELNVKEILIIDDVEMMEKCK